jgi:hypothetical protein
MRRYVREILVFTLLFGVVAFSQSRLVQPAEASALKRLTCNCTTCDGAAACGFKRDNKCTLNGKSCTTTSCSAGDKCISDE